MVDFRINVIVDPSRVPQGTRKVTRALGRVENKANQLRRTLGITFGALAGGALIFGAVRAIARFEESIATAGAVSKATAEEFEQLESRALSLGLTTRFTATQAADALVSLSRAGFTVAEAIESVDDTLRLAQAAGLGLAEATDITASTIRGFRLEVDQAARVTDVLVEAANRANTNVQQLGNAIKFVAPVAAGLGQKLELTTAALGVLSDAGLKASLAGTGLRRVLAELEAPSTTTTRLLGDLGLTADQVQVSTNGLVTVLERLRDAGVTTGEGLQIFGQRGGPAFEVLVSNIPKIKELNKQLENSGGVAAKVAKQIDDTLNGALFRARSAIEGFALALGKVGASTTVVGALDGIIAAFRFLAENADTVFAIISSLITVLGLQLVVAIVGKTIPAFIGLTASIKATAAASVVGAASAANLGLAVNTITVQASGATVALTAMRTVVLSMAAAFTLAAGGVFLLTRKLQEQRKNLEAVQKAQDAVADSARFNALGTQIRIAGQEIRKLARAQQEASNITKKQRDEIIKLNQLALTGTAEASQKARAELDKLLQSTGSFSDSQRQRAEQLIASIRGVRREARKQAEEGSAVAAAQAAQAATTDNLIARLDRQIAGLQSLNRENEIRQKAEEEIQRLLQAGQGDATSRREEIEDRFRQIKALEDQKRILNDIKGPQEQFQRDTAALSVLLRRGAISAEEFKIKLQELRDAQAGAGDIGGFDNALESLIKSNEQLQLLVDQGKFVADAVAIENALRAEGVKITREVQDNIAAQLIQQKELNEVLKKRNDAEREGKRIAQEKARIEQAEQRRIESLAQQINFQQRLNEAEGRLQKARDQGLISTEQQAKALADLQLRGLEASTALGDGFTRAFAKISREAENLAVVGEKVVNVFADRATDALVEFATTGQINFKEFANAILADLIRIIARLLVVQALNAAFGGGVGTAAGAFSSLAGGRQDGGTVQPARSFVVGENGPELFVPDRTGTIVPNAKDQAPQQEPMIVQIVNVKDPDEVPNTIASGAATDAIINELAANKDRVNQVLK